MYLFKNTNIHLNITKYFVYFIDCTTLTASTLQWTLPLIVLDWSKVVCRGGRVDSTMDDEPDSGCVQSSSEDTVRPLDKPDDQSTAGSTRENILAKCKWCCKKIVILAVSNIGLTCIVVTYSIIGAFMFEALEAEHERTARTTMSILRRNASARLWQITVTSNIFQRENWTEKAEVEFVRFQGEIYRATKEMGWDGVSNVAESEVYWSFTGALLYCVTVITTIGIY